MHVLILLTFQKVNARIAFCSSNLGAVYQLLDPVSRGEQLSQEARNNVMRFLREGYNLHPQLSDGLMPEIQKWILNESPFNKDLYGQRSEAWYMIDEMKERVDIFAWWSLFFNDTKITKLLTLLKSIPPTSAGQFVLLFIINNEIGKLCETITGNLYLYFRMLVKSVDQAVYVKCNLLYENYNGKKRYIRSKHRTNEACSSESSSENSSEDNTEEEIVLHDEDDVEMISN